MHLNKINQFQFALNYLYQITYLGDVITRDIYSKLTRNYIYKFHNLYRADDIQYTIHFPVLSGSIKCL